MHKYEWNFYDKNGDKHLGVITYENCTYLAGDVKCYNGKYYKITDRMPGRVVNGCDLHVAKEI